MSRLARLRRTLGLLAAGNMALDEIAYAGGFCDQAHFNREFRHYAGLTPTAYLAARARQFGPGEDPSGLFIPEGTR